MGGNPAGGFWPVMQMRAESPNGIEILPTAAAVQVLPVFTQRKNGGFVDLMSNHCYNHRSEIRTVSESKSL